MRDGKCCFGILFEIVFDVRKQHNNMIHIKFNQNASNMVVLSVCDQLINKLDVQEVGLTRFSIDVNLEVVRRIPATLLPFYIRWPYQNYVLLSCSEFSRRIYSWPIFRCNVGKRFVVVVVGSSHCRCDRIFSRIHRRIEQHMRFTHNIYCRTNVYISNQARCCLSAFHISPKDQSEIGQKINKHSKDFIGLAIAFYGLMASQFSFFIVWLVLSPKIWVICGHILT